MSHVQCVFHAPLKATVPSEDYVCKSLMFVISNAFHSCLINQFYIVEII